MVATLTVRAARASVVFVRVTVASRVTATTSMENCSVPKPLGLDRNGLARPGLGQAGLGEAD